MMVSLVECYFIHLQSAASVVSDATPPPLTTREEEQEVFSLADDFPDLPGSKGRGKKRPPSAKPAPSVPASFRRAQFNKQPAVKSIWKQGPPT